ncbi:MAG: DUF4131 domain-containing protein, partial [Sphingomonadales bacterium]|nr:DUF4131 domain-containing protein [Sphingomonadales bacterium]
MRLSLCAYCLGIVIATFMQQPDRVWPLLSVLTLLSFPLLLHSRTQVRLAGWLLWCFYLGCLWHGQWAEQRLRDRLPQSLAGTDMLVQGVISDLPQQRDELWRFAFDIHWSDAGFAPRRVLLSYYGEEMPRAGQRWQWRIRLQAPHGFANPGAFDYEAHLT